MSPVRVGEAIRRSGPIFAQRYGQGIVSRVFERATLIPVGVDARAEATREKK